MLCMVRGDKSKNVRCKNSDQPKRSIINWIIVVAYDIRIARKSNQLNFKSYIYQPFVAAKDGSPMSSAFVVKVLLR